MRVYTGGNKPVAVKIYLDISKRTFYGYVVTGSLDLAVGFSHDCRSIFAGCIVSPEKPYFAVGFVEFDSYV